MTVDDDHLELKRDLMTALSLLEEDLTDAEAWEVYVRIAVFEQYEEAFSLLRNLATSRGATDVVELLEEVARRAGVGQG